MSYTFPSVTINYITYTALRWAQFPTIAYTVGAVAGSEVVTVTDAPMATPTISVQIASGVSTNLQIKTAIANALGDSVGSLYAKNLVNVAITAGHNADTNTAVGATPMTGAVQTPLPVDIKITKAAILDEIAVATNFSPTAIFTPKTTGMYQILVYSVCTASATNADAAPNMYIQWTDETTMNQWYVATPLGANATLINYGVRPIWCIADNPINFYTSGGAYASTLRYNFHFVVIEL